MKCILNNSLDPYFNLASEEYLLKNTGEEVFMLWRCDSSVIVGKHQNTLAEINYAWVKENNIRVARRLTGGGTVYHDPGNINFTIIRNGKQGHLVDYPGHLRPIIEILNDMGVHAEMGKKNEILLGGKKISGNAEHIYKSRILHHGTLLFDADLKKLNRAITLNPGKYQDKAVKSVSSEVTNIRLYISGALSTEAFVNRLFESFIYKNTDAAGYSFNRSESEMINRLAGEKYSTWEWIYGYSPGYRFENRIYPDGRTFDITMDVKNGIIASATIGGNFLAGEQADTLAKSLIRQKHDESAIYAVINKITDRNVSPELIKKITDAFF